MRADARPAVSPVGRLAALLATWFGVGLIRPAPGTWGSLAGLLLAWPILAFAGAWWLAAAVVIVVLVGIWAAGRHEATMGHPDPGRVVIDEVAGMWITLLPACATWHHLLVAFVAFRVIDILKPWPASWADRRLKGGFGIMVDDVMAGVYAALCVIGWRWIWGWSESCPT
ncbi:MAG: phosphatidylglycerophosphatase A [Alphaproteobacteria bacterium]